MFCSLWLRQVIWHHFNDGRGGYLGDPTTIADESHFVRVKVELLHSHQVTVESASEALNES